MLSTFISAGMSYLANRNFISEIKCSVILFPTNVLIIDFGSDNSEPKLTIFLVYKNKSAPYWGPWNWCFFNHILKHSMGHWHSHNYCFLFVLVLYAYQKSIISLSSQHTLTRWEFCSSFTQFHRDCTSYLFTICCVLQSVTVLKIRVCTAKQEANSLPGAGCCTGSRRPSGGMAWLLSAKEKLSQEKLSEYRLEKERKACICSITDGLETVKNRQQKYHSRLQRWWRKVLFAVHNRHICLSF